VKKPNYIVPMFMRSNNSGGFTLVELMVTISLIVLFSVAAATYSRSTDQQISLYREQGNLINAIYKARSLSVSTYAKSSTSDDVPCGYGIYVPPATAGQSPSEIIIFKDLPDVFTGECPVYASKTSLPSLYDGSSDETVETIHTDNITVSSNFQAMLFVPPDPQVYTTATDFPLRMTLSASRVAMNLSIEINAFGVITTNQSLPN